MKNILDKIIDPFAFTQVYFFLIFQNILNLMLLKLVFNYLISNQITLEASINIIDDICKSDLNTNDDLYVKLLNGLVNFTKYIEKIFVSKMSNENELSTAYEQFNNGNNYLFFYKLIV